MAAPSPPRASLLGLPLELRQQIYHHLIPESAIYAPLKRAGMAETTHRPPSKHLLRINRQIMTELWAYYYRIAVFTMGIYPMWLEECDHDPDLDGLAASRALQIVRVHLKISLSYLPQFKRRKAALLDVMARLVARACEVLSSATRLEQLTISVIDNGDKGPPAVAWLLPPLQHIAREASRREQRVRFIVGLLFMPQVHEPRETVMRMMRDLLGPDADVVEAPSRQFAQDHMPTTLVLCPSDSESDVDEMETDEEE